MKILLDVHLKWDHDLTHVFLLSLAKSLEKRGAEIVLTPNSRSPILRFEVLSEPDYTKTSQSPDSGPLWNIAETSRLNQSLTTWGYPVADADSRISHQIKLLMSNKVTDVVVWGNSHPTSIATYIAAKCLGLRAHVLERGLVPESWILAANQPWIDNCKRHPKLSRDVVREISGKATAQFQDQSLAKYPELPIAQSGEKVLDVGFFTGHPEALGFSNSAYSTRVDHIVGSLAERLDIKKYFIRPHPAHVSHLETNQNLVRRDGNLMEALRFSRRNIVLGSNVWAASILAGQPTLLVEWQGNLDKDAMSISALDSINSLEELDRQIHIQAPILRSKLQRHLSEDHFYISDSLPSTESLADLISDQTTFSYGRLGAFEETSRSLLALATSSVQTADSVRSQNADLQAQRASILGSRTWRWSAPIRHIASLVQSVFLH